MQYAVLQKTECVDNLREKKKQQLTQLHKALAIFVIFCGTRHTTRYKSELKLTVN